MHTQFPLSFRHAFIALISIATIAIQSTAFAQSGTPTTPPDSITPITTLVQTYGPFDPTRPCTGLLVDARHLKEVKRAQSPMLLAAPIVTLETTTEETVAAPTAVEPVKEELYPDPKCLPTLDMLQEEGIVRFYHTVEQARKGFVGDNPYIVHAVSFCGPYCGDLVVCTEDAVKLKELEKTIHYTKTWKVGFLLPEDK